MHACVCVCVWQSYVCVREKERGIVSVGVCSVLWACVCMCVWESVYVVVVVWVCVRERGSKQVFSKWGGDWEIRRELVMERDLLCLQYPVFPWILSFLSFLSFLSVYPLLFFFPLSSSLLVYLVLWLCCRGFCSQPYYTSNRVWDFFINQLNYMVKTISLKLCSKY